MPEPSPPDRVPPLGPPALPRLPPGRFTDFLPVGQGGMGFVYRAFDTLLAREVAFKVARPDAGADRTFVTPPSPLAIRRAAGGGDASDLAAVRARFVNEACVTSGIEHPSIAPIYDLGETEEGLPWYAMRWIPGHRTLADGIAEAARAGPDARLALLEPILRVADAVAYAHARGIVHRDLKPQNVALGEFGEVVVLDWGLAKARGAPERGDAATSRRLVDVREALALETVGSLLGTPGWLAPEGLSGDTNALDERSDVFALGVVLFEALTGRLPWPAEDPVAYAEAVARGPAPQAADLEPAVPAALSRLCARALEREPARRLPSAAEFAAAVRGWQLATAGERERERRLAEARSALAVGAGAQAPTEALDRAAAALERLRTVRADDPELPALEAELATRRRAASAAAHLETRRRTRRRAAFASAGALVAMAIGAALLVDGKRRDAESAHAVARRERVRAEDDMRFMLYDLRERLEPLGRLDVLAAVADRAETHYRTAPGETPTRDERLGRAVALRLVGEVHEARGDLPRALESFDGAVAASAGASGDGPEGAALALEASLDRARRALVLDAMGRRGEALAIFRRHVDETEALAAGRPPPDGAAPVLARAHASLARALVRQNDLPGAGRALARAREIAAAALARRPGDASTADLALEIDLEAAQVAAFGGDWAGSLASAAKVLERADALASEEPGDVRWNRRKADAILRLVVPLARSHDLDGAWRRFREAEAIFARESAADPTDQRWAERSVALAVRMADALTFSKQPAAALGPLGPALEKARWLVDRDPSSGRRLHLLVDVTDRRAAAFAATGDPVRALAERQANVAAVEVLVARDPENLVWRLVRAYDHHRLAEAHDAVGDRRAALERYRFAGALLTALAAEITDDPALRLAAAGARLGEGRNEVRLGERGPGLAAMREGIEMLARGAREMPDGELPYRAAQAREELAMTLDPADPAEREEGRLATDAAIGWTKSVLEKGADPFAAAMLARLEALRARHSGG